MNSEEAVSSRHRHRSRFKMQNEDKMSLLRQLFAKATSSVLPHVRLRQIVQFDGKFLNIEEKSFQFPEKGCHIFGFGKAVIGMAAEMQRILGPQNIQRMVLSVPHGICDHLRASGQHIQLPQPQKGLDLIEGAKNNIPDLNALKASQMIESSLKDLKETDLVLVLVSGGGSALLPAPKEPLTLESKAELTKELSKKGASIQELNAVRIQLSNLKGGKLAQKASPAQVIGLILSDIVGSPLELISSGPTINPLEMPSALEILEKYGIKPKDSILEALNNKLEIPKNSKVYNLLIGSNDIAIEAAKDFASVQGLNPFVLSSSLIGEAKMVGAKLATLAFHLSHSNQDFDQIRKILEELQVKDDLIDQFNLNKSKSLLFILGGETIVHVTGSGLGGRNQEMVMATMIKYHELVSTNANLERVADVTFLSAGTDGIDGPTEAAGAIANQDLCLIARNQGLDPYAFLHNNDSNGFFKCLSNGQNLIITGHTGTNVMDIQALLLTYF